jgi:hypothetical protein
MDEVRSGLEPLGVGVGDVPVKLERIRQPRLGPFIQPFFEGIMASPYNSPNLVQPLATEAAGVRSTAEGLSLARRVLGQAEAKFDIDVPDWATLEQAVAAIHKAAGTELTAEEQGRLAEAVRAVPAALSALAARILAREVVAYQIRARSFAAPATPADALGWSLGATGLGDYTQPMIDGLEKVDLQQLCAGGQWLAREVEALLADAQTAGAFGNVSEFGFEWKTPIGAIAVRGSGSDSTPAGTAYLLILDAGDTSDHYAGGASTASTTCGVSILIDWKGDDVYEAPESQPAFGSGIGGYALLWDGSGNDRYSADALSLGCGVAGVGALLDAGGTDTYAVNVFGEGAAAHGIGLLLDLGPDSDAYTCFSQAQGHGFVRGAGMLIDEAGDDTYTANDTEIRYPSPQTAEHNTSLAQGCGFGRRDDGGRSEAGGVGILVDVAGNDKYSAALFAQGVGYWAGTGLLCDLGGDDHYSAVWYAMGSSAHFAAGILWDGAGNDSYCATHNMVMGTGNDYSFGLLIDSGGDDSYDAPTMSLGYGWNNGEGILWDVSGKDTYAGKPNSGFGRAGGEPGCLERPGYASGFFFDTGGGDDTYPEAMPETGNGKAWHQTEPKNTIGAGVDH